MVFGVDSLAFLAAYAGLSLAAWIANAAAWRWALSSPRQVESFPPVGLYDLALLRRDPELAVDAAIAALYERDCLREGVTPGTLALADGVSPTTREPLERELLDRVRDTADPRPRKVKGELADGIAIQAMLARLTRDGLLVAKRRRWLVAGLYLATTLPLILLGVVALVDGADSAGRPIYGIALCVLLLGSGVAETFGERVFGAWLPLPTNRGDALVAQRRDESGSEDSAASTVALGDASNLWSSSPALAALLGVPRERAGDLTADNCACCGCG